jgi:hypothetical protein
MDGTSAMDLEIHDGPQIPPLIGNFPLGGVFFEALLQARQEAAESQV